MRKRHAHASWWTLTPISVRTETHQRGIRMQFATRWACIGLSIFMQLGCAAAGPEADAQASESELSTGTYLFVSGVTSSRCLDVAGGSSQDRANIRNWTCNF